MLEAKHEFVVNSNGNTGDDIKNQFARVIDAANVLEALLESMDVTHGRNYQTLGVYAEHHRQVDLAQRVEAIGMVRNVKDWAYAGAARVVRQREGL